MYFDLTPDWRLVLATTLLAAATTAVFGVIPALRAARTDRYSRCAPDRRASPNREGGWR